jgi:hypothetical protein
VLATSNIQGEFSESRGTTIVVVESDQDRDGDRVTFR